MAFDERAKKTALAIVQIFETGKPLGVYGTVAVLNDGAGLSYGKSQFTHKSGNLFAVIERFQTLGGTLPDAVADAIGDLRRKTAVLKWSENAAIKRELKALGSDPIMRQAQDEIAFERFLSPAIKACEGSGFVEPLSLAVVYDSLNHGSWAKIRDRVPSVLDEKKWITRYVTARDSWLESVQRLRPTAYRTDFFLAQIARGNWKLELPMNVHGRRLSEADIQLSNIPATAPAPSDSMQSATEDAAVESQTADDLPSTEQPPAAPTVTVSAPPPTGFLSKLKAHLAALGLGTASLVGLQDWFNVQLSGGTVEILKVIVPTLLVLGFIGFVTWYVTEKVVGWKTLKMRAEIATDPNRPNLTIKPQ